MIVSPSRTRTIDLVVRVSGSLIADPSDNERLEVEVSFTVGITNIVISPVSILICGVTLKVIPVCSLWTVSVVTSWVAPLVVPVTTSMVSFAVISNSAVSLFKVKILGLARYLVSESCFKRSSDTEYAVLKFIVPGVIELDFPDNCWVIKVGQFARPNPVY